MTNYAGNEALRADVAALANSMCDLRATLNALESRYRYDAENLTERMARQTICRINAHYLEAYRQELDASFKTDTGGRKRPSEDDSGESKCTEHAKNFASGSKTCSPPRAAGKDVANSAVYAVPVTWPDINAVPSR